MEGKKFLRAIWLENILSFGPGGPGFPLEPLNVFIGPNASGKSNLISALSLLAAAPRDIQAPIGAGGGVNAWLWKGAPSPITATIDAIIGIPQQPTENLVRYYMSFTESGGRFSVVDEVVGDPRTETDIMGQPYILYHYNSLGGPAIEVVTPEQGNYHIQLHWDDVKPDQSILSQRRDRQTYPELTYLAELFDGMRIYREWNFAPNAPSRLPQRTDLYQQFLFPDASNLGVLLSGLLNQAPVKARILDGMRGFYPSFSDINIQILGGTAQIFFHEEGLQHPIPAARLSDGSLRYLCLLAVLCHPEPPPVICIEEPEIGLHPDIIPEVAKLLVEASSRSQIFVTTHSDILVDALTDTPEAVVVCEKYEGATKLRRLDAEKLKDWLDEYRLGEIWVSGQIGGNRW